MSLSCTRLNIRRILPAGSNRRLLVQVFGRVRRLRLSAPHPQHLGIAPCVTSTALGSIECDCALQLDAALARINAADRGILIYLTDQEGRGQGLTTKVRALANKNRGLDTFTAVEELGLDAEVRTFHAVPPILDALDIRSIVLLTGNPDKRDALVRAGVKVDRTEPLEVSPNSWTRRSMRAKQARGHTVVGQYADDPLGAYP